MNRSVMQIAVGIIRSIKLQLPDRFPVWIPYCPHLCLSTQKEIKYIALDFIKARSCHIKQTYLCFNRCGMTRARGHWHFGENKFKQFPRK